MWASYLSERSLESDTSPPHFLRSGALDLSRIQIKTRVEEECPSPDQFFIVLPPVHLLHGGQPMDERIGLTRHLGEQERLTIASVIQQRSTLEIYL